jgi:subtilisin family serine protease
MRAGRRLATLTAAGALALVAAAPLPVALGAPPVRVGLVDSGLGAADPTGHGSEVAAVLRESAAARRVPLRLVSFPDVNRAGIGQPRLMARAIRRAAAARMRVVNISQVIRGRAGRVRRALAAAPETLFVVAAGNEGLDLDQPNLDRDPCGAPLPNVVCVGALGPGGRRAAASNYGARTVDVWAPGPGGTSFAAPRVTARAAALIWRHPGWPPARARAALVDQPGLEAKGRTPSWMRSRTRPFWTRARR